MHVSEATLLISGAGPAGCTLALQLAQWLRSAPHAQTAPVRIILRGVLGEDAAKDTAPFSALSPRTLALNQGSCALLQALGVEVAGADILTVHVSQKNRLGRTLIEHHALGQPRLGRVVTYADLRRRLQSAVQAVVHNGGITLQHADEPLPDPALHIVSDGQPPRHVQRHYHQHAVLAVVRASQPRPQWAFERFTREGPLALLPHPAGPDVYSAVWCCPPAAAQWRHTCDAAAFDAALNERFGQRLGRLTLTGERLHVPLALHAGPQWTGGRQVVIGNAAQTLHPVAGQGLNLALRDAAQLAQALRPWLHQPALPPEPLLQGFQQKRALDRWLTVGVTDLLPRVFATGNPLLEHACGLALTGLDVSRSLRLPLARHLLQGLRS